MKAARQRVKKYRSEGAGADLARVEVLVPPWARKEILAVASRLRAEHRANKELRALLTTSISTGSRIFDRGQPLSLVPSLIEAMRVHLRWGGKYLSVWVQVDSRHA